MLLTMENLKQLSVQAHACTDKKWRNVLLQAHMELDKAIDGFWRDPCAENLRYVNCLWAMAHNFSTSAPAPVDPNPPLAGAPRNTLLTTSIDTTVRRSAA